MTFITKRALPRRTFLRGMGVTLALPLLDSMIPAGTALAQTAASPKSRFCGIYVPHGATMDKWTPATEGTAFEITETLKPLEKFRDRLNVVRQTVITIGSMEAGHRQQVLEHVIGKMAAAQFLVAPLLQRHIDVGDRSP